MKSKFLPHTKENLEKNYRIGMDHPKYEVSDLLLYEMPNIAKYFRFNWIQEIIAKIVSRRINRKISRYNKRLKMIELLKSYDERN